MKKYILSYLLPNIVLFSIIYGLIWFLNVDRNDDAFYLIPIFSGCTALLVSILSYMWAEVWGPKQREKLYNKEPFISFIKLGFVRLDQMLVGYINGYQVLLFYNPVGYTGKPSVGIKVLFDPRKNQSFIGIKELKEIQKKHKKGGFEWARNYIWKQWEFNFKPPSQSEINLYIEKAVYILKVENLKHFTMNEADLTKDQFDSFLEKEKSSRLL